MSDLTLKFKVDFIVCSKCSTKPKNYSKEEVNKFLRKHRRHNDDKNNKFLKVVGYLIKPSKLKDRKIAIRFVQSEKRRK